MADQFDVLAREWLRNPGEDAIEDWCDDEAVAPSLAALLRRVAHEAERRGIERATAYVRSKAAILRDTGCARLEEWAYEALALAQEIEALPVPESKKP